jgi:hypothetical protein
MISPQATDQGLVLPVIEAFVAKKLAFWKQEFHRDHDEGLGLV